MKVGTAVPYHIVFTSGTARPPKHTRYGGKPGLAGRLQNVRFGIGVVVVIVGKVICVGVSRIVIVKSCRPRYMCEPYQ